MLNLAMLELILSDFIARAEFAEFLELTLLKLRALPETIPIGCKLAGGMSLNSNLTGAARGKNRSRAQPPDEAEVQGLPGLAGGRVSTLVNARWWINLNLS
jgi:hypothetical protein